MNGKWNLQGTTDEEDYEYEDETEIETEAIVADEDDYEYPTSDIIEGDVPPFLRPFSKGAKSEWPNIICHLHFQICVGQ